MLALRGGEALSVRPLTGSSPYVPLDRHGGQLRELAREAFPPGRPIVEGARALCQLINSTFTFDRAFTDMSTPLSVVLEARRGVCQDFAHVAAGCLRSLGLAARYVSGYLGSTPGRPPRRLPRLVLGVGAAARAGSTSTRPTTTCRPTATSPSPGVATTAT